MLVEYLTNTCKKYIFNSARISFNSPVVFEAIYIFFLERMCPDTTEDLGNIKDNLDSLSFWTSSVLVTNHFYLK